MVALSTANGISLWQQTNEVEVDASENPLKASMANRKVTCRICQGEHFTAKCPYKDSLGNIAGAG